MGGLSWLLHIKAIKFKGLESGLAMGTFRVTFVASRTCACVYCQFGTRCMHTMMPHSDAFSSIFSRHITTAC